jgi:hypothetical protein
VIPSCKSSAEAIPFVSPSDFGIAWVFLRNKKRREL